MKLIREGSASSYRYAGRHCSKTSTLSTLGTRYASSNHSWFFGPSSAQLQQRVLTFYITDTLDVNILVLGPNFIIISLFFIGSSYASPRLNCMKFGRAAPVFGGVSILANSYILYTHIFEFKWLNFYKW